MADLVTKEQYGLWKHEPVSQWFFTFLRNKAEFLTKQAADSWLDGKPWPDSVRGQIIELIEILALEHEYIEAFYQEGTDGAQREGS